MIGLGLSIWRAVLNHTPAAGTDVILKSGDPSSAILKAGGAGYIKKAG